MSRASRQLAVHNIFIEELFERRHFSERIGGLVDLYCVREGDIVEQLSAYGWRLLQEHYFYEDEIARWIQRFDVPKLSALIASRLPDKNTTRTGELGEMFAVEYVETSLGYKVPIRRFRYRDSRNVPMHGDDALAVELLEGRLFLIRVEAKNNEPLSRRTLNEAYKKLARSNFLPSADTLTFTARILREQRPELADAIEDVQAEAREQVDISLVMFAVYAAEEDARHLRNFSEAARGPFTAAVGVCIPSRQRLEDAVYDVETLAGDFAQ